jgi:cyclase
MLVQPTTTALQQVAEDVFAFVQPGGGWCVNNAGLIAGDGPTVLVDTVATESRARRLRDEITYLGAAQPGMLVNTHHHGDHTFGNAQFVPEATVIAHALAREEMAEAGLGLRGLWPDVDWGETPLVLPQLTFTEPIVLYAADGLPVHLLPVGPAHTTNDVVAWIPERGVLFAGDVVMSGVTPFCLMGSIRGSIAAVHRLRELDPAVVVGGHGPVGGPELLDRTEAYLAWLWDVAADAHRAGLSPLDAARQAPLGAFADLLDAERIVGNLHRAYAEIEGRPDGAPMDILGPFTEMVAYLGRTPACHA